MSGGTGISRLYYEAHITVAPYEKGSPADYAMQAACEHWDMRVSTFLMFHENKQADAFTSMRSQSYADIAQRMRLAVTFLRGSGHVVKRFKIEDTLLDSKRGDELP